VKSNRLESEKGQMWRVGNLSEEVRGINLIDVSREDGDASNNKNAKKRSNI